jgi:hypothetical protein
MKGRASQDAKISEDYEGERERIVTPPAETMWLEMSALTPQPGRLVVLRKSESEEETAMWKRSRRWNGTRWEPYTAWVFQATKTPIDFEPQAWRPWP